jgi:hypothetical protein
MKENGEIKQTLNEKGEWILSGATEALKEHIRKYPTYKDIRREHNKYWGLPFHEESII